MKAKTLNNKSHAQYARYAGARGPESYSLPADIIRGASRVPSPRTLWIPRSNNKCRCTLPLRSVSDQRQGGRWNFQFFPTNFQQRTPRIKNASTERWSSDAPDVRGSKTCRSRASAVKWCAWTTGWTTSSRLKRNLRETFESCLFVFIRMVV